MQVQFLFDLQRPPTISAGGEGEIRKSLTDRCVHPALLYAFFKCSFYLLKHILRDVMYYYFAIFLNFDLP